PEVRPHEVLRRTKPQAHAPHLVEREGEVLLRAVPELAAGIAVVEGVHEGPLKDAAFAELDGQTAGLAVDAGLCALSEARVVARPGIAVVVDPVPAHLPELAGQ